MANQSKAKAKTLPAPTATRDGQGQDHDPAFDVVAASMTEKVEEKTPRDVLAVACIRSLVQLRLAGIQLNVCEGAILLKTLAQRLKGRRWIEKEVQRLMVERVKAEGRP